MILTPVLTRDSIILSFKANVSPCFILILFLSKHFIAYLKILTVQKQHQKIFPPILSITHLQLCHAYLQYPVSKLFKHLNPVLKTSLRD